MADRIDRGWEKELRDQIKQEQGPLLSDGQKKQIEHMLIEKLWLKKTEAMDCIETIENCAGAKRADVRQVIIDSISNPKVKADFMEQTAKDILPIVTKALEDRESRNQPKAAQPSQASAAKENTPKPA